jgi:nicotinamidase-related amidase
MPTPLSIVPARTAILSMDFQTGIVSIYTKDDEELLSRVSSMLKAARASGMRIIHIQVRFRPGLPEIGTRNALFNTIKNSPKHQELFQGPAAAIHPAVAPETDDIVVTKHRVNAFTGTDLEMILRAQDIDTLIMWGIATSGVVLSTMLHAADADYRVIVIRDCCADANAQLHNSLMNGVFSRQGTVVTSTEFLDALKAL